MGHGGLSISSHLRDGATYSDLILNKNWKSLSNHIRQLLITNDDLTTNFKINTLNTERDPMVDKFNPNKGERKNEKNAEPGKDNPGIEAFDRMDDELCIVRHFTIRNRYRLTYDSVTRECTFC